MTRLNSSRRMFLKAGLGGTIAGCLPTVAGAQTNARVRLEWKQFRATNQYPAFLNAIAAMRSNTTASNRSSLRFWADVHVNRCPHGVPYFIAWHRGYLYYFEQQLRIVSGNPDLTLPYWDYYSYATLPPEFTDPSASNPLYMPRLASNVRSALSLAPFAPTVVNFQRGKSNAFEPKLEDVHNPVHDLIGGVMSTMSSPMDPIFYLHHASIDRLTHAWNLSGGKLMPKSAYPYSSTNSDPYWAGNHLYATSLSIERYKTLNPGWLNTTYANTKVPASPPPVPSAAPARASTLQRPPFRSFRAVAARRISATRRSVGGVLPLPLDEQSVSVLLRLQKGDAAEVARIVALGRDDGALDPRQRQGAIKLVIDNPTVIGAARRGGFFYALYLDMPAETDASTARERSFVGTLGAFQIAAAAHHGAARLEFDVSYLLAQQGRAIFPEIALSWIRIDGDRPPAGKAIQVDEVRIELAYELAESIADTTAMGQEVRAAPMGHHH